MARHLRITPLAIRLDEAATSAPDKIQICRVGTFYHPVYGKFSITKEVLSEMKKNFDERVRGIDIAIDFSHESEKEAAGWIKNLSIESEGQELWAEVKWTPRGAEAVKAGEYRYISPEFVTGYKDNESLKEHGATLLGVGLTNRPVIKRMEAVVELEEMSPEREKEYESKLKKDQGGKQMEEYEKMSPEQLIALVKELKAKCEAMMAEKSKYEEEKKMAEKEAQFNKMLTEGKAVAAQKDAFIKGDMVTFAELAQKVNTKTDEAGNPSTSSVSEDDLKGLSVDEKIHKLAEEKMGKDKKYKTLIEAYRQVLRERDDLRKEKYGER